MAPSGKKKSTTKRATTSPAQLALLGGLASVAGLGCLEPYVWVGALINELGFHLAIAAVLLAVYVGVRRAWIALGGLLAFALMFAWPLFPLYRPTRPTPQTGPLLRVATAHLSGEALPPDVLASWLARERPDAMALTGLRDDFGGARLGSYRVARRGDTQLRTLLLVQSALVVPERPLPLRDRLHAPPSLTVRAGRCQARAIGLELPPLGAYTALEARERAIARATELPSTPRSVWLGQLGSRAAAHDLAPFMAHHSLRNARLGHGRLANGPGALGALGFPLSHVLVHGWISVREVGIKAPLVAGAQRTLTAVVELTEARCRFTRAAPLE